VVIKSIASDEDDILLGIMQLHNDGQPFDLDPTFSRGAFYRSGRVPMPVYRFDLNPVREDVLAAGVTNLPLADCSIGSVIFDPPFIFNPHGRFSNAQIRFSSFPTWDDMERTYRGALDEFKRILRPKGIVAFKCQDNTDSKSVMTHCHVWQWATMAGFYAKDVFIRYRYNGPVYNPYVHQRHARKFHSYWWVFVR